MGKWVGRVTEKGNSNKQDHRGFKEVTYEG